MESMLIITILLALLGLAIIGGIVWFIYMKLRYKTVPSNVALIITGPKLGDPEKERNIFQDDQGRYMKVIRGGGHRLRMFQTSTPVPLTAFQLQITSPTVHTLKGVPIEAEAVAMLKVADSLEGIARYAEQFLGKDQDEIDEEITEVLAANLRAILAKLTVEDINNDRESFNQQVTEIAQKQLDDMGFRITSLGLTDLRDVDNSDYLTNLGRPETAQIRKHAEIAEATNRRETEIHKAQMNEQVEIERYEKEISISESRKAKELTDAKIKAETDRERARTEAAYSLEQAERSLEVESERLKVDRQKKQEELDIQLLERQRKVELEQKEVEVRRAAAEADYYEEVKRAEAAAEAKKRAGEAEAEVIAKKSQAEVQAIRERAKAIDEHKEVMLLEMVIEMLPEFARAVSEPISNVDSIRILDNGDGKGMDRIPNSVTSMMTNMQDSLKQMTGLDLNAMLNRITGGGNNTTDTKEPIQALASKINQPKNEVAAVDEPKTSEGTATEEKRDDNIEE
ncbi:flotillin family protein [Oceanobacillus sp. 1P07AA]|uniref:flotillin family protein n=1 Tax=Oceanobacillus sp. 1P07AA TaxID=3132293 RepID=UPI0039A6B8AF